MTPFVQSERKMLLSMNATIVSTTQVELENIRYKGDIWAFWKDAEEFTIHPYSNIVTQYWFPERYREKPLNGLYSQ